MRLKDIAKKVGVSRTTVSNVLHGNTKKVSLATAEKIKKVLDEENYIPNKASSMLYKNESKIIGLVIGTDESHGFYPTQDTFVGEFIGAARSEAEKLGYYLMLIGGKDYKKTVNMASSWNIDGLIILFYTEERLNKLKSKLNKKMVLIDTYPKGAYNFYNVGIDDYSGGYQVGKYLLDMGFDKAIFAAETEDASDYYRWKGFKKGQESKGGFCSRSRYVLLHGSYNSRMIEYKRLLPMLKNAKAIAFSSDYMAIEGMNFFLDNGIKVPDEISVVGFDDNIYANIVRPKLTTVHQDVREKAFFAVDKLVKLINNESLDEMCIRNPVYLVKRNSVKKIN